MMKITVRMLAALLALLLIFSGAALAEEDTAGLLATVDGVGLPIDEALAEYEYMAEIYSMYGYSQLEIEEMKLDLVVSAIREYLIGAKAQELNLVVDEEEARTLAQEEYDYVLAYYEAMLDDGSMTAEELTLAAEDTMALYGYTMEAYEEYYYNYVLQETLIAACLSDISATEEELAAYYEQRLEEEKEMFDGDPYYYEEAVSYGETVTYVPEGFRAVKHILVMLDSDSQSRMYEIQSRLMEIDEELATGEADGAALADEAEELRAEQETILDSIRPTVEEIQDRLAAGEDFDALMEEYGEDTGMKTEPYRTEGYVIWSGSSMEEGFLSAAMKLENVGDISEPAATPYGLHIIRYERAIPSGPVAYEEVKEALREELEYDMESEAYSALLDEWYAEAEIIMYLDNFDAEDEEPADGETSGAEDAAEEEDAA